MSVEETKPATGPGEADDPLPLMRPRRDDRRLARGGGFRWRRLTASLRAMPDFLVVGAMKSGTSSLFAYLASHPLVVPPLRKETHYFTAGRRAGLGEDWYRAHFPLRRPGMRRITGEATPGYMFEAEAMRAIAASLPEARLVMVLRDPVERAFSHWRHEVRMGRETLSFAEAVRLEDERCARAAAAGEAGRETWLHASYKARGLYLDQIRAIEALGFGERLFVLGSGALLHRPAETLADVFAFLGLPPLAEPPAAVSRNRGGDAPAPEPGVVEALEAFFAPHNAALFDHLGGSLDWSAGLSGA